MLESSDSESEYHGAFLTDLHPMRIENDSLEDVNDRYQEEQDEPEQLMASERSENSATPSLTLCASAVKTRKLTAWTAFQKENMVIKTMFCMFLQMLSFVHEN
jgi:hypothetical protein